MTFTNYTSICKSPFPEFQVRRSHFDTPPAATGCIYTGGGIIHQSIAMIQTQYNQTMQQTSSSTSFSSMFNISTVYFIILKSLSAAYVTRNKISNTSGNIFNAKPCWGSLFFLQRYHRGLIFSISWACVRNVVLLLVLHEKTRECTYFFCVCVVHVSAIVTHSLETAAEM